MLRRPVPRGPTVTGVKARRKVPRQTTYRPSGGPLKAEVIRVMTKTEQRLTTTTLHDTTTTHRTTRAATKTIHGVTGTAALMTINYEFGTRILNRQNRPAPFRTDPYRTVPLQVPNRASRQ